jgi:TolA-binding protein
MREASPTGGALGQVAIQELAMLQSTIASLDKGQKQESLVKGLEQVRKHFQNWKNAVLQAQQGAQPAAPAAPAAPKRRVFNPANGKFE